MGISNDILTAMDKKCSHVGHIGVRGTAHEWFFSYLKKTTICRRHGVNYQLYADDTQVYVSFSIANEEDRDIALGQIKACIAEIQAWMLAHKLNSMKTKLNLLFLLHPASPR